MNSGGDDRKRRRDWENDDSGGSGRYGNGSNDRPRDRYGRDDQPRYDGGGGRSGSSGGGGFQYGYNSRRGGDDYHRNKRMRRDGPPSSYGGGGGRRHNGSNRPYHSPFTHEERKLLKIKELVVTIGDDVLNEKRSEDHSDQTPVQRLAKEVENLVEVLSLDMAEFADKILSLIVQCAGRLSMKSTLYGVLSGLMNAKDAEYGEKIVKRTMDQLQQDISFVSRESNEPNSPDIQKLLEEESIIEHSVPVKRRKLEVMNISKEVGDNLETSFLRIRLLARFLQELMKCNVISREDLLYYMDSLQSVCIMEIEVDGPSSDGDVLGSELERQKLARYGLKDFFSYVVLESLYYSGHILEKHCTDEYQSLISRCQEYMEGRENESKHFMHYLKMNMPWEEEVEEEDENENEDLLLVSSNENELKNYARKVDPLAVLWQMIQEAREKQDGEDGYGKLIFAPLTSYMEQELSKGEKKRHALVMPTVIISGNLLYSDPVYYCLFRLMEDDSGVVGLSSISKQDVFQFRMYVRDTIAAFQPSGEQTARRLLHLIEIYKARHQFSGSLPSHEKDQPLEYLLIEEIFIQVICMNRSMTSFTPIKEYSSTSKNNLMYTRMAALNIVYQMVLLEEANTKKISSSLLVNVELFFRFLTTKPSVDSCTLEAFSFFLSGFLSCVDYKWAWQNWSYVVEEGNDEEGTAIDPAEEYELPRHFVSLVLERCVRLSYFENIQKKLPEKFHILLPPNPAHTSLLESHTELTSSFYPSLMSKLKSGAEVSAIKQLFKKDFQVDSTNLHPLFVFCHALLELGSSTVSHLRGLIERYKSLLRGEVLLVETGPKMGEDSDDEADEDEAGAILLDVASKFWKKSPQRLSIVVDLILRSGAIHGSLVVEWFFTKDSQSNYSYPYMWHIMQNALEMHKEFIAIAKNQSKNSTEIEAQDDAMESRNDAVVERMKDEFNDLLVSAFEGLFKILACEDIDEVMAVTIVSRLKELGRKFRKDLDPVMKSLESDENVLNSEKCKSLLSCIQASF